MSEICYIAAMEYRELLNLVHDEPLFETSLLLAGDVQAHSIQRQLARWQQSGHVVQLRRGLYSLALPYRHHTPHPFLIANRLVKASYISCQSALAWYGLIPEYTPITTSVTTLRPGVRENPFGTFRYQHIKRELFFGYMFHEVGLEQYAYIASPEKAILDLVYLTHHGEELAYLQSIRLQNLSHLNLVQLKQYARMFESPKLLRAVQSIDKLVADDLASYKIL
jgi:predicted transcriptional regulator of viral defense system